MRHWNVKGLNNAYAESIIRKAISGSISTTHVAARLGIAKQCVNKPNKCKDCIEKVRHRSRSRKESLGEFFRSAHPCNHGFGDRHGDGLALLKT